MFSSPEFPAYVPRARAPKPPARIRITSDVQGRAHRVMAGNFDTGVTEQEVRQFVYHPMFGGRDLRVDLAAGTFAGIRHTD